MKRGLPSIEYLKTRVSIDIETGIVSWINATKYHANMNGQEAGSAVTCDSGKQYWHVKIDGKHYKRSHLVFLFATGKWPENQIDHINGNSLDDRSANIRQVTPMQNAWNHKGRKKKSGLPMGIRLLPSGKYQARIACNHEKLYLGTFDTMDAAVSIYQEKRKELFGEYA